LIQAGVKIKALLELKKSKNSKKEFKSGLEELIINNIPSNLDAVEYGKQNNLIKNVLLLFNVQTILNNPKSQIRFPFDNYSTYSWDLEHIRSIKDDLPPKKDRKIWVEDVIHFLNTQGDRLAEKNEDEKQKLLKQLSKIMDDTSSEKFKTVYEDVLKFFNEDKEDEQTNSIGNLTLLDSKTNRSYKNAVFPVKRSRIIENDKSGSFVPICTKNVFLKFYSKKSKHLFLWEKDDIDDYADEIKETLSKYYLVINTPNNNDEEE